MTNKRKLTLSEIDDILSVISPPKTLPKEVINGIKNNLHNDISKQLKEIVIYPQQINSLKKVLVY